MKTKLTARQREVLHFVEDSLNQHSRPPTLQEICDHFGFSSLSSARDHLRLIERKGFLTKKPHSSRSIRIVHREPPISSTPIVLVPLLGNIAAGAGIFALEEIEDTLTLPSSLFRGRELFALRVQGDSMIGVGIYDRDIAVLKSQPTFSDGDIVAVIVSEEATLKRAFREGDNLRLHPENAVYSDKIISPDQKKSCRIAGVLVGTIRQFL